MPSDLACVKLTVGIAAHDQPDAFVAVADEVLDRHARPVLEGHSDGVGTVASRAVFHDGGTACCGEVGAVVQEHDGNVCLFKVHQIGFEQHAAEEQSVHPPWRRSS